jgi:hypothetical protein
MVSDTVVIVARTFLSDEGYPPRWLERYEVAEAYSRVRDLWLPEFLTEPMNRPFQDDILILAERKLMTWNKPVAMQ